MTSLFLATSATWAVGCGGATSGPAEKGSPEGGSEDAASPEAASPEAASPEAATTCSSSSECAIGDTCVFPVGSCDAKGKCINGYDAGPACGPSLCDLYDAGPGCEAGAVQVVCGCGKEQSAGCGWPLGYASGPTTGEACETADAN